MALTLANPLIFEDRTQEDRPSANLDPSAFHVSAGIVVPKDRPLRGPPEGGRMENEKGQGGAFLGESGLESWPGALAVFGGPSNQSDMITWEFVVLHNPAITPES